MWLLALLVIGGLVALCEHLLTRRGFARPWIYAWALAAPLCGVLVAIPVVESGLGTAAAAGLALAAAAGGYPAARTVWEYVRTSPPRYRYVHEPDDPSLDDPLYQATDLGAGSAPLRPVRPEPPPAPPPRPRLIPWREAARPEGFVAGALSLVVAAAAVGWVLAAWPRPWRTPAQHVAVALADEGYLFPHVRPAAASSACDAGRETAYRWTALGVEGQACRTRGGRVSYIVTRRWRPLRP